MAGASPAAAHQHGHARGERSAAAKRREMDCQTVLYRFAAMRPGFFSAKKSARIDKNRQESTRIDTNRLIVESTPSECCNFVIANEGMPVEGPDQHTSQRKATQIGVQSNVVQHTACHGSQRQLPQFTAPTSRFAPWNGAPYTAEQHSLQCRPACFSLPRSLARSMRGHCFMNHFYL